MFVNRLSEDGERLYRELFKSNPAQSEWARLIEKGCGTDRTLAALFFNMHARRCGWATQLFPDMQLEGASMDVWIGKGAESCYVDIAFDRNSNWKKLALTGNKIFIFAGTADLRQRLSGDCKLDQVTGVANDIETLAAMKYKRMNPKSNLWAEEW